MPEKVTTKLSFFETEMEYGNPFLNVFVDRARIVSAIYDALKPWNINVDDIDFLTTGKPSEQGVKFKLPWKQSAFFVGPVSCKFTRDNTDWTVAEETIQIINAVTSVLEAETEIRISKRKTVIALHLQPENLPFMKLLSPFVSPDLSKLENRPVEAMAAVINWKGRKLTIDTSAHVANGIFLRLERDFDGSVGYDIIAERLLQDEEQVFQALGIEG
jgi:hypothetical protein